MDNFYVIIPKIEPDDEDGKQEDSDFYLNGSDVFQSVRIRHYIRDDYECNRFVLDYHRYFLPSISLLFWIIFLLFGN